MEASEVITGINKRLSSKRVGGLSCIAFAMVLCLTSLIISDNKDIASGVQIVSLQFLFSGTTLLIGGVFEKKQIKEGA